MTISSYKVDNILKQYTKQILPEKNTPSEPKESKKAAPTADTVNISDEGKQRIRERFQNEILDYLSEKY